MKGAVKRCAESASPLHLSCEKHHQHRLGEDCPPCFESRIQRIRIRQALSFEKLSFSSRSLAKHCYYVGKTRFFSSPIPWQCMTMDPSTSDASSFTREPRLHQIILPKIQRSTICTHLARTKKDKSQTYVVDGSLIVVDAV